MAMLIVMDHTGDSRHLFNPADAAAAAEAQERFKMLNGAGYIAAKRTGSGTSELIRKFDRKRHCSFHGCRAGDAGSSGRLSTCAAYDFRGRSRLRLEPGFRSDGSKAQQPELSSSRGRR
jgi:hypothetical protein